MSLIIKKINQFNKIFNKEEKMIIICTSLVILFGIILGFMALMSIVKMYIELTFPYFLEALNKLVGVFFEGWTLY